jgi:hypothetical protein
MRYFLISVLACSLAFASCKHNQGATNEYKNAKVHPSDREAKSRKKLTKKAEKQARKSLKKARKKHGVPTN